MQNDFLPGGSLAVPDGDAIIPLTNSLQEHYDLVVASQDWHPAAHKSFASSHKGKVPFEVIEVHGLQQRLWPDHCVQGTWGAEFSDRVQLNKAEAIFRKGTDPEIDSYSIFYDNEHRKSTGLAGYLREKGVDELYLAGLAGDYCVYYSAIDSLKEGFTTFIIEDATRPIDAGNFRKVIQQLVTRGAKVIQSSEVPALLKE